MNKLIKNALFTLFASSIVFSCYDNEDIQIPQYEKVSVEFDTAQVRIHENEELQIIRLYFKKPALKNVILTLAVNDNLQSRVTIEPALLNGKISLNVLEGQHTALINFLPENNSLEDGNLEFTIIISETSPDIIIGARDSISVTLQDDDSPAPVQESIANFIETDKNVMENNVHGKTYSIKLSEVLSTPGSIEISLESPNALYGTTFNTIPAANNGKVILSPSVGYDQASLTFIPIDNTIITGEIEIILRITGTTGPIVKGSELIQAVYFIQPDRWLKFFPQLKLRPNYLPFS